MPTDLTFTKVSVEQFNAITALPCSYCGTTDKIGVDRIDNTQGYLGFNCASCCGTCNFIKRGMSVEELKRQLAKMVKHMGIVL